MYGTFISFTLYLLSLLLLTNTFKLHVRCIFGLTSKIVLPGQSVQDFGLALNIYLPIMPIMLLWSSNHDGSIKRKILK